MPLVINRVISKGIDSSEPIILAKTPDYNAIPIFHFITFGDENKSLNEQVARTFEGTWNVNIQIEGYIQENGNTIDLLPIPYTISFKFEDFSLIPMEIVKHKRQVKLSTT